MSDEVRCPKKDNIILPKELRNAKFAVGLRAQGHIPYIVQALKDRVSWDDIAGEIHWEKETAREWFIRDQQSEIESLREEVAKLRDAVIEYIPKQKWHRIFGANLASSLLAEAGPLPSPGEGESDEKD